MKSQFDLCNDLWHKFVDKLGRVIVSTEQAILSNSTRYGTVLLINFGIGLERILCRKQILELRSYATLK